MRTQRGRVLEYAGLAECLEDGLESAACDVEVVIGMLTGDGDANDLVEAARGAKETLKKLSSVLDTTTMMVHVVERDDIEGLDDE